MTFKEAVALRTRIERGELIPPFEYPLLLALIQDLVDAREHLDGQHAALIKTQAFLTRCQQSRRRLRSALETYGQHRDECALPDWRPGRVCTCGFDAALAEAENE